MATYLIAHTQRTGSNWLCDVLAQTRRAGVNDVNRCGLFIGYGEGLAAPGVYPERLDQYFTDSATPNGVIGMKSDWDYLDTLDRHIGAGTAEAVLARFTHFIYLRRRDVLAQAISWYIAGYSGVFTSENLGKPGKKNPLDVLYDRDAIKCRLERIFIANARWKDYFKARDITPLKISYEDLRVDMAGNVGRVLNFLGVSREDVRIKYSLQQQINPLKAEFARRYRNGE